MTEKLSGYSNLTQRIIAALVAVPLIIVCIFYSPVTFWLLFLFISILTQYEFYKLIGLNGNLPLSIYGTICGATLNTLSFLIERNILSFRYYYVMIPLLTITFFIKLYRKTDSKPFENLGYTFLGIIYVAVPFTLVNELVIDSDHYRPYLMMGVLIILWINDSGAYFAGSLMGKRKLFERISPKKTWEGFMGGAVFSLIAAYVYAQYYDQLLLWQWLGIAVIIVITGTLGDLVESLFKRSIAIKDSGSIIPGHGGFLDRFDGLLLSMPFILTFLKIFV
jgi:phosphatidate cytidylyltransferase